jgi:hypothetical protein
MTEYYRFIVPIAADGTYATDRVTARRAQIGVMVHQGQQSARFNYQLVPASPAALHDLVLRSPESDRTLDVLARSTLSMPLDGAQVLLFPGQVRLKDVAELMQRMKVGDNQVVFAMQPAAEAISQDARDKLRPGDLLGHFTNVPAGDLTACAIGISGDISDPALDRKIQLHVKELALKCELVGATDDVVVLDTPPQKRFD